MLQQCLNFAKSLYNQKASRPLGKQKNQPKPHLVDISTEAYPLKRVPRYLQLAMSIHAHFSDKEEKQNARYKAAEQLSARKNALIMQSLQDILEFCELLRNVPELGARLDKKTEDITQRLFSNRSQFVIEQGEFISINYCAPQYQVDLSKPQQVHLTNEHNAFLHINFSPVKFMVANEAAAKQSTVTKYLMVKQYKIVLGDAFLQFQTKEGVAADPVADILTEIRARLGHEFFEDNLLPYLRSSANE